MATTVKNESNQERDGGIGFFFGFILMVAVIMFLMFYGIPYLGSLLQPETPVINIP